MLRLLLNWLLSALALLIVAHVVPGFHVSGFGAALWAVIVIGLVNANLGLFLKVIKFPLTILTLGILWFIINALMFWAAASVLEGFDVRGFGAALLGSLIYSAIGVVIESALERLFPKQ